MTYVIWVYHSDSSLPLPNHICQTSYIEQQKTKYDNLTADYYASFIDEDVSVMFERPPMVIMYLCVKSRPMSLLTPQIEPRLHR